MLKYVMILLATTFCTVANTQPSDMPVRKQLFDDNWKFILGDIPGAHSVDFNAKNWRMVDLPHDWSIEGTFSQSNPTGAAGGYLPAGTGWYRKKFTLPPAWQGKKVWICFEGVYMNAEVFINGHSLGIHPYGYTSFSYDLTTYIKYQGENIVAVRVDNSKQINCRWYSGSGIYRHVWLTGVDPLHIDQWGVAISTEKMGPGKAVVQVKARIKNEGSTPQRITLSTQLQDQQSTNVGGHSSPIEIPGNSEQTVVQKISIDNPRLWSPEYPAMYNARLSIQLENRTIDEVDVPFGIRTISWSAERGFLLNGEPILLNGGCVHHDNGCLGAAAWDRAEERRVELLKSAGFNAVRTAHNPPSEAFLDACDRLGMLVIDEAFDGWRESKTPWDYATVFDEWWARDLRSMILRDRNHPSVIMWSIGNEIIERTKPEAVKTAGMLAGEIRTIDTTRPVTSAMTTWGQGWEIFDPLMAEHDICGYNYQLHEAPKDHERVPSRVIVQTESFPKDAFYCWDMADKHPYIIGDFVWTALDYLGESGIGRAIYPGDPPGESWETDLFPWHGSYCGDIDLTGWRKPVSHYRNVLWNQTEKLYMAIREPDPVGGEIKETMWAVPPAWESWTWPGFEGREIQVEVYSKYPKVRLYLNDKLIDEKPTTRDQEFRAIFPVLYEEGTLKAVGVIENRVMESTLLKTAGKAANIKLTPDRAEITANGRDLSFVTLEITDANGIRQPNAENELKFSIDGPGEIVGVDNGNTRDTDPYVSSSRKAWHGRALVVIKSRKEPGVIKLRVSSEGLPDASLEIRSAGYDQ